MSTAAVADKLAATPSLQGMDSGRNVSTGGGVGNGDARTARYVGVLDSNACQGTPATEVCQELEMGTLTCRSVSLPPPSAIARQRMSRPQRPDSSHPMGLPNCFLRFENRGHATAVAVQGLLIVGQGSGCASTRAIRRQADLSLLVQSLGKIDHQ